MDATKRIIPEYSSDEEIENQVAFKKIRRISTWKLFENFNEKSLAENEIRTLCKFSKARGQQCSAAAYLLYDSTNSSV